VNAVWVPTAVVMVTDLPSDAALQATHRALDLHLLAQARRQRANVATRRAARALALAGYRLL
jgi:hypothetical protein